MGVLFANHHHSKQLEKQLNHEKVLKEQDRKFELRRDVYLKAAEELMLAQQHLVTMSHINVAEVNPAEYLTNFFVATTKATLVAADSTATAINELVGAYTIATYTLMPKLGPIQDARDEKDLQNEAYEHYQSEIKRIISLKNKYQEEGDSQSINLEALTQKFQFNSKKSKQAGDARDNAWSELNQLTDEFMLIATKELKNVSNFIPAALVAIREELGISSDIDSYRSQIKLQYEKSEEMIESFIKDAENESA